MNQQSNFRLSSVLSAWYAVHKRDLPWRQTGDPYFIWLSEIILQQTRVAQGYDYFVRFAERFPTVIDLANADEDEVLKLWQGLGYYSRARNLHFTAKKIATVYRGVFPKNYKDILALKGVGEYTAAAIVSFAYDMPYAVVDGNVYRVLSRIFAIDEAIDSTQGKKIFAELADEVLDKKSPGLHNQAMMEFGALQCVPVSPDCANCPASSFCLSYSQKNVANYPKKQGKLKTRNRYFNYLDIRFDGHLFLKKRIGKDIWQNLYELPLIETDSPSSIEDLRQQPEFIKLLGDESFVVQSSVQLKHVLSHQIIYASFYRLDMEKSCSLPESFLKVREDVLDSYAISRLTEKYLEKI